MGQDFCELWAVERGLLQTDPSWADLEFVPPCPLPAFLPFRGLSCSPAQRRRQAGPWSLEREAPACVQVPVCAFACGVRHRGPLWAPPSDWLVWRCLW